MNPELKKQWTDALRSGKYKQIRLRLHAENSQEYGDGFCCLGVLCEIDDRITKVGRREYDGLHEYLFNGLGNGNSKLPAVSQLPDAYAIEIGLCGTDHWGHLTIMNDSGKTFEEIADYIDERL
jgi:hypothetical protein